MSYFIKGDQRFGGFHWIELHHMYWGFISMFVGFVGIFEDWNIFVVYGLLIAGLWMTLDDVVQHLIQRSERKKFGYYRTLSFLNWAPYKLLYWMMRQVNG